MKLETGCVYRSILALGTMLGQYLMTQSANQNQQESLSQIIAHDVQSHWNYNGVG